MKDNIEEKIKFIKAIESVGVKYGTYKMIFKSKGKYGEPEAWLYPNPNNKRQKFVVKNNTICYVVDKNNNPVIEYATGTLVTKDTIQDKKYLKEYLCDFIK